MCLSLSISMLEAHLDGGEFSFLIPLNDNFTGGGTTFLPDATDKAEAEARARAGGGEDGGDTQAVQVPKRHFAPVIGQMLMFPGQKKHIGEPVTSGIR